jgi:hypothetical protein
MAGALEGRLSSLGADIVFPALFRQMRPDERSGANDSLMTGTL